MLSGRLVHLIETNWKEIANRLSRAIQAHPDMQTLAKKSDADLREWCQEILENLGELLSVPKEQEAVRRFELMGKVRYQENLPLHEAVMRFHLLRAKIVGFVREQGYPLTAMQLYEQEELEERMAGFFDACVYHIVRGYERAFRRAARIAS